MDQRMNIREWLKLAFPNVLLLDAEDCEFDQPFPKFCNAGYRHKISSSEICP